MSAERSVLERILIPLDGSALAESVLPRVRGLLRRSDSEVILARAAMPQADLLPGQQTLEATQYVEGLARKLDEEGIRVRSRIRLGPAAEAILEMAVEEKASLIALSSHGRSGISRWVFGSVAEKILRGSTIPVLVVRSFPSPASARELDLKKILVPVDGSANALKVAPLVTELSRLFNAEIHILTAETLIVSEPSAAWPATLIPEPIRIAIDGRPKEILEAAARQFPATARIERTATRGDAAMSILDYAKRESVDLIAITSHGYSGLKRWVMGSVAEKVLRHSDLPMLVVRSAE